MNRVLQFEADDKLLMRLLWEGFNAGAAVERQKKERDGQSREDRKSESRIKRELMKASVPVEIPGAPPHPEDPSGLGIDRRPRTLGNGGCTVKITQGDFARLERYIAQTPWIVDVVEHAAELEDWLDACPKEEEKP